MANVETKLSPSGRPLGIGSCFAAGAMMLSHMNSSGLSRYDDMMADLARLHSESGSAAKRSDRPQAARRIRWTRWIAR